MRELAFQPPSTKYRDAGSGRLLWEKQQGQAFEDTFGAPHLLLHRADLHSALAALVPSELVQLGKRLTSFSQQSVSQQSGRVSLRFADGTTAEADALIAADGVHSLVREALLGRERPRWTGRVAFRTVFPAHLLNGLEIDDCTKWVGPDRHIVIYYINPRRDEVYFVTSTPEPGFDIESWSSKGDMAELRAAYADFHPQVRGVLAACPEAHKWALVERDPLPRWGEGRVYLLGDACHPMTPYMAQGAASAIEDAAILARCLQGCDRDRVPHALRTYEATRKPRTSHIQMISALNNIDRFKGEQENVYAYDVLNAPLVDPDQTTLPH